jgi:hypothetical protein
MSQYFNAIVKDLANIAPAIDFFEKELIEAKTECRIQGSLEKCSASLPGITEHRFNQLQEIEAILEHLEIMMRQIRGSKFREYLEHYKKLLTSRDAEKYVDSDPEVITQAFLMNDFSLLRNKYLGVMKALEQKSFQVGHVTRLRTAGMEDIIID